MAGLALSIHLAGTMDCALARYKLNLVKRSSIGPHSSWKVCSSVSYPQYAFAYLHKAQ